MRIIFTLLLSCSCILFSQGQNSLKTISDAPYVTPQPISVANGLKGGIQKGRTAETLHHNEVTRLTMNSAVDGFHIMSSGSFWIDMKRNDLWQSRSSVSDLLNEVLQLKSTSSTLSISWKEVHQQTDYLNQTHIRVQQTLGGFPIKGQEMILHVRNNELTSLNGFVWTASQPKKLVSPVNASDAIAAGNQFLTNQKVRFQKGTSAFNELTIPDDEASLIWFPKNGNLILAYELILHPNPLDHWTVYVNAATLEVLQSISETCSFAPLQLFHHVPTGSSHLQFADEIAYTPMTLMDGATVTTDQDLLGQNRTVNGFQVGTNFFMIDASRTGMFMPAQSVMPNEPIGVIWTIDAQNSSPQQSNFEVVQVTNINNNWKNLEVSAHYNAGQAYEYYKNTFNRNSINGMGGNIISIINVTDDNDNNMDNAFWNGAAMFYGNGDVAFTSLAKGLDVAGHEMSHGVIQSTANLEYMGQSGALNESYADVFGSLIDRDDWRIGEDVVNLSFFPSGALRDLANPNNGGSGPGDNGWQPKHMNEFQNLPNTPDGDNGGVHVNSGIPNRAYFLFANVVGKEKAEKVYYKALTDYLVKSSQFIDMRLAIEKAATDIHGANSAEVIAARSAFDQVGIGSGQGGDYEDDIDTNNGDDFILATDENESDLYFIPPTNPSQFVKMNVPAPISRPSFTDDGVSCVYVNNEHNMIVINFDWSQGLSYQAFFIENNPQGIWRNVVVSKDGTKIAFTTSNLRNEINVFDFEGGGQHVYTLYNPTTGGVNSEDVLYADAMEWDYSGQYVMYDALNRIESSFGDGIEYWDISFLNAWNNQTNNFGVEEIGKLYSSLPENVSVGNPSFSKNSPYIITFDFAEDYFDNFGTLQTDYWVIAANIEQGTANNIYHNTTVGYPSYSRLDDKILFTYYDANNDQLLLATIDVEQNDKTVPVAGTDVILITGAQKGVWFVVGNRDFTATTNVAKENLALWPTPATTQLNVKGEGNVTGLGYVITDQLGKVVKEGVIDEHHTLSVDELTPGLYQIQLKNKPGIITTGRFVKQ